MSLFFWGWGNRDRAVIRCLFALVGVADLGPFWVAVDEQGEVIGSVGLHRFRRDAGEAVWLSWYCVAPESRGREIGARLLDHAIARAAESGARFLRLYTGDGEVMARAQDVYESRGLRITKSLNLVVHRLLQRQPELPRASADLPPVTGRQAAGRQTSVRCRG